MTELIIVSLIVSLISFLFYLFLIRVMLTRFRINQRTDLRDAVDYYIQRVQELDTFKSKPLYENEISVLLNDPKNTYQDVVNTLTKTFANFSTRYIKYFQRTKDIEYIKEETGVLFVIYPTRNFYKDMQLANIISMCQYAEQCNDITKQCLNEVLAYVRLKSGK